MEDRGYEDMFAEKDFRQKLKAMINKNYLELAKKLGTATEEAR